MSLSETELIYLMAYVDHQVDDDELPEVLALLERSEEARQIVAQHEALGDWVRSASDKRAVEGGADGIAERVLADIEKLGGGKVIAIETERARLALNRQRVKEFGALFAVAAAAAAFWLMPASRPDSVAVAPPQPSASSARPHRNAPAPIDSAVALGGSAASPAASGAVGEAEGAGVDVQSVESPDHPFSIFYVPAATGQNAHSSSVVVWIGE
jgi:hypothetical protein